MRSEDRQISWHDYERNWRSDAMWVDLQPVRARVEAISRRRPGRNEKARIYNTVGECAAAILLGGSVETTDHKKPDLFLPSGETFEVRTSFWGGNKKWEPKMTSGKRGPAASKQKKIPSVWCVTKRYPDCFDGAWVVGIIAPDRYTETRMPGAGKFSWAWTNAWVDDGRFIHPAELMQDELAHPMLQVGMPYRRSLTDEGIPEYLEGYGF